MPEIEHLAMSNNACMGECAPVVSMSTCMYVRKCMHKHVYMLATGRHVPLMDTRTHTDMHTPLCAHMHIYIHA